MSTPTACFSWNTSRRGSTRRSPGCRPPRGASGSQVAMLLGVHVHHRAAAGHVRHPVGQQLAAHDEHARCAGSADELVRARRTRVLVRRRVPPHRGRSSRCRRTERRRRSPRTTVRRGGARVWRCRRCPRDPGDIATPPRTSRSSAAGRRTFQLGSRSAESMCPSASSGMRDDVGDRFTPRQLIGVVLERPTNTTGRSSAGIWALKLVSSSRSARQSAGP